MSAPQDSPDPAELVELVPSRLDDSGAGLAAYGELDVHVAGALPGEAITARLVHRSPHRRADGRRDAWATLAIISQPSAARVAPVCPAYGACGGCVLQHLALPAQLAWKRAVVEEALAAVPIAASPRVLPAVPSPSELQYRNQAKYVVSRVPGGPLVLGAYAPRSHEVVDLAGCRLVEAPLDEVARTLRELLEESAVVPYDERTHTGQLRYVVLRASARGEVLVALVTARAEFPQGPALAAKLRAAVPRVVGVVQNVNASAGNVIFGRPEQQPDRLLDGRATLPETIAGVTVDITPPAFLQLNRGVASAAYQAIAGAVTRHGFTEPLHIVDLYAGVGAIAFHLADLAREIVAIEENPAATAAGAAAAARAGKPQVRFVTAEAAVGLATLAHTDVVVLNPPRAGASSAALAEILRLGPRLVVYLSCNPTTLARDLALLTSREPGFAVTMVQPFDMLPHTAHVETFAVLTRDQRSIP